MTTAATLTSTAKDSIAIDSFIYHIIRNDTAEPSYNDKVTLTPEQKTFFEEQIKTACDGTQFMFSDPEANSCKNDCLAIIADTDNHLSQKSRELTNRFCSAHNRSMNEGVFIVAVISLTINNVRKRLISFLKVDYSTVYQQEIEQVEGRQIVTLTKVMDSLADNQKALQKWAIIDVSNIFSWDVLALQRHTSNEKKDTDTAISQYFRSFLQVYSRQTPNALTKGSVSETSKWAQRLDQLPEDFSRSDFKARAINYFENTDKFDTNQYIDHVLGSYFYEGITEEEKESRIALRETHKESLRNSLAEAGIAGQVFESRPASIPNRSRKTTLKTGTGVTISYQGTQDENNISVTTDGEDRIVTIRSTQIDEA